MIQYEYLIELISVAANFIENDKMKRHLDNVSAINHFNYDKDRKMFIVRFDSLCMTFLKEEFWQGGLYVVST